MTPMRRGEEVGAMTRPSGTVTFLFTDLESSTRLWEDHPEQMQAALARHDALLRDAVAQHDGYLFGTAGDAISAAFVTAEQAVAAAVDAQQRLRSEDWPGPVELRARMGIHTGVAEERDGDYFGPTVNRAARICAAGHGGQVLVSPVSTSLLAGDWELHDLGRHRLKDLPDPQRLRQVVIGGDRDAYPPLRGTTRAQHNLPFSRTSFHGRTDELDDLTQRLSSERVLTLNGPGGVGKTRLALELARRELERRDAVVFTDLSPVESPGAVAEAIVAAASLPVEAAPTEQLAGLERAWRNRRVLLVLDNCEHLLDATADAVDHLTSTCEQLDVLATSREPLGLDGERVHRVPSLDRAAAVHLFTDRARAVREDLELDRADEELVEEICERLDGLPLAIELAASRVAHLGLAEIASHLDDRFRLLTGSRRHARRRQQTLQATVDWSYDLLSDEERSLLRATAVFVGRFDLESVAAVWGRDRLATVDALSSLVDKSLVTVVDDEGEAPRYRLLETIRLYAQDRLVAAGEAEERREAHARHLLGRALEHPPQIPEVHLFGQSERQDVRDRLENYLAALAWFGDRGELAAVGQLAGRLPTILEHGRFMDTSGAHLGRDDVLAALDDQRERVIYLTASAMNANFLGRFREQLEYAERAFEEAGDPGTRGAAAVCLTVALSIFDVDRVERVVDEALEDLPANAVRTRTVLECQRAMAVLIQGDVRTGARMLEPLADIDDVFPLTELLLARHVLGEDITDHLADLEARADGTTWGYRAPLLRGLAAAAAGDHAVAAAEMLAAAEAVEESPFALLDHDVVGGCAAIAYHRGEVERTSRLLAPIAGPTRSPAAFVLYRHYRDRVRAELSTDVRHEIVERHGDRDAFEVLQQELEVLRAIAGPAAR